MRKIKLQLTAIVLLLFVSITIGHTQRNEVREKPFLAVGINYGYDFSAADLADRYGNNFHAGLSLSRYSIPLKGFWGIEGNFQFGSKVKEDVLAPLRLESGAILGNNGQKAELFLRRRGAYIGVFANKTLISAQKNPNSGLNIGLGFGILQHNIRILNDSNNASQVNNDYSKGYDRNSRGLAAKQTIGYQNIGINKSVNYSIALSITEGFTESVRAVNFDTGLSAKGRRLDILIALEATWYLPIYEKTNPDEIFY